jgi:phage tail sheath protein FI
MPTYLSPGVYVEETSSGNKPLEGVGTALCAFVGFTEKGPVNEPVLVTNWTQYTAAFGAFTATS